MIQRTTDCHHEMIISSLQGAIKRLLKYDLVLVPLFIGFKTTESMCFKLLPFAIYFYFSRGGGVVAWVATCIQQVFCFSTFFHGV